MMTMTRQKLMLMMFISGFLTYSYYQLKEKFNLATHLGITKNQLETTTLCMIVPFAILLPIVIIYYAKKFNASPTDFGYSMLLGGIISVILGSLMR